MCMYPPYNLIGLAVIVYRNGSFIFWWWNLYTSLNGLRDAYIMKETYYWVCFRLESKLADWIETIWHRQGRKGWNTVKWWYLCIYVCTFFHALGAQSSWFLGSGWQGPCHDWIHKFVWLQSEAHQCLFLVV